jgi:hypothetical protein
MQSNGHDPSKGRIRCLLEAIVGAIRLLCWVAALFLVFFLMTHWHWGSRLVDAWWEWLQPRRVI